MRVSLRGPVILATLGLVAISTPLGFLSSISNVERAVAESDSIPIRNIVAAPGVVEPASEEREIGSQVIGIIREMRVKENEKLQQGQIIAVVENSEQVARVASARAELSLRQAELQRLLNGARPEERREARAAYAEAQANLAFAREEYNRRLALTTNGTSSKAALDLAESNLKVAEARSAVMAERLELLEAGSRAEDIAAARAQIRIAEANLAVAGSLLEKTYIRSPIAGTVLRLDRLAGEAITNVPPTRIAIVGDIRQLRVRAEVDETDIGRCCGRSARRGNSRCVSR